jgi:hypothetical protein
LRRFSPKSLKNADFFPKWTASAATSYTTGGGGLKPDGRIAACRKTAGNESVFDSDAKKRFWGELR